MFLLIWLRSLGAISVNVCREQLVFQSDVLTIATSYGQMTDTGAISRQNVENMNRLRR